MTEDISKQTIIILVILTVTISLLGTWTVINEVNNIKTTVEEKEGTTTGQITLTIDPPEQILATGRVTLTKTA